MPHRSGACLRVAGDAALTAAQAGSDRHRCTTTTRRPRDRGARSRRRMGPAPTPGILCASTRPTDSPPTWRLCSPMPWRSSVTLFCVIALIGNLSRDLVPAARRRSAAGRSTARARCSALRVPARIVARCAAADRDVAAAAARPARHARSLRDRRATRDLLVLLRRRPARDADRGARRQLAAGRPARSCRRRAGRTSHRSRGTSSRPRRSPRSRGAAASRSTGKGLVRVPEVGPLRLDADYDPEMLRHIWVLKLAEEEAEVRRRPLRARRARGAASRTARAARRSTPAARTSVTPARLDVDPTGAGDAFMTGVRRRPERRLRPGRGRPARDCRRRRGARAE